MDGGPTSAGKVSRRTALRLSAVLLVAASTVLAGALFRFVPIHVDGSWYTYPALALHEGRDPGDNQRTTEALLATGHGRKVRYFWDSRRNLYVAPTALWFREFGASWESIRGYGVFQLLLLSVLSGCVIRAMNGNGTIALVCWALFCSDSAFLANGTTDGRPDLLLTLVSLSLLLLVTRLLDGDRRLHVLLSGMALAAVLPLLHLTALVPLSVVGVYAALSLVSDARGRAGSWQRLAPVFLAAGSAFILRSPILDWLFPSHVPEAFAQDAFAELRKKLALGLGGVFATEGLRWYRYFWPSNWAELLFVCGGIGCCFRGGNSRARSLLIGCFAGAVVVAVCSPSPRVDHLMTLLPLALIGSSLAFKGRDTAPNAPSGFFAGLLVLALVLKGAHAGYIVYRYSHLAGLSGSHVASLLEGVAEPGRQSLIVGPAEIWPYLPDGVDVTIDDDRMGMFDFHSEFARRVDYVVLNADYLAYQWRDRFHSQFPDLDLQEVRYLGDRDGSLFLGIYRVVPKTPLS